MSKTTLERPGLKSEYGLYLMLEYAWHSIKDILTCFSGTCAGNVDLWLVNPCEMGRAAATVDVIGVHTQRFLQF